MIMQKEVVNFQMIRTIFPRLQRITNFENSIDVLFQIENDFKKSRQFVFGLLKNLSELFAL